MAKPSIVISTPPIKFFMSLSTNVILTSASFDDMIDERVCIPHFVTVPCQRIRLVW